MLVDLGWRIDAGKILTRRELALVLHDLAHKAGRFANARLNRVICRRSCCCGLRASETSALQLGDVRIALLDGGEDDGDLGHVTES